jgi:hypothetical protein
MAPSSVSWCLPGTSNNSSSNSNATHLLEDANANNDSNTFEKAPNHKTNVASSLLIYPNHSSDATASVKKKRGQANARLENTRRKWNKCCKFPVLLILSLSIFSTNEYGMLGHDPCRFRKCLTFTLLTIPTHTVPLMLLSFSPQIRA